MGTSIEPFASCPETIGRGDALRPARAALGRAWSGQGQVLLIGGEAGIGKTRLIADLRQRWQVLAEDAGEKALTLIGQCFEPDLAVLYAPLLDLAHGQSADDAHRTIQARVAALLRSGPADEGNSTPDAARQDRWLFEEVVQLFTATAEARPILLIFEDIHWCDETSLDLLLLLARRVPARRVALALTYRSDEIRPPLRHFLAEIGRLRLAHDINLSGLSRAETGLLVQGMFNLDHAVQPDFLDALYALTEGVPFFVEEVLRTLVAAGDIVVTPGSVVRRPLAALQIPLSVQDAVQRRVATLSPDARATLAMAAVSGRRFGFSLLHLVTGRSDDELLHDLKELIAAHLVVETSADEFRFRHALTRQAIYDQLLMRERQDMHRSIGAALERQARDADELLIEDLSYHYAQAGAWEQVLDYASRAGMRAHRLGAPAAVVEHLTRAMDAAGNLGQPVPAEFYAARGQAHEMLGNFDAARDDYEARYALASSSGDQETSWHALLDLGFLWTGRDYARARPYLERALRLARLSGDSAALAHGLNRMGNWYANAGQIAAAIECHKEALEIFARLGDDPDRAATLELLSMASWIGGDANTGMQSARAAVALFRSMGDRRGVAASLPNTVSRSALFEACTLAGGGTADDALDALEEALSISRDIGWRTAEAYHLALVGEASAHAGQFDRALVHVQQSVAMAEEIGHRQWMAQAHFAFGAVLAELLDPERAEPHFTQAHVLGHELKSPLWIALSNACVAWTQIQQNRLRDAEATFDGLLSANTPMVTMGERLLWMVRAELDLAQGEPARALDTIDQLYATVPDLEDEGDIPRLALPRARALVALARDGEAEDLLEAARAEAANEGTPVVELRALAALAGLAHNRGEVGQTLAHTAAARALLASLTVHLPDDGVRDRFHRTASAMLPTAEPVQGAGTGLTRREREVAALIVQGQSNRAIADALFVTERTVESHTSSILRKLGYSSRTQIATWITAQRLAPTPDR